MAEKTEAVDTLIIGAGVSGLAAAAVLGNAGQRVLVLDKGRSPGGRLATRRIDDGVLDHGAQYFTARSPQFVAACNHWQAQDWIAPWGAISQEEPRYWAKRGMNALAKSWVAAMPQNVAVRCNQKVERIEIIDAAWQVFTDSGLSYTAAKLLVTAPVPQALALIRDSWSAEMPVSVEEIAYAPCLALLLTLKNPMAIAGMESGFWRSAPGSSSGIIASLADNQAKGISPQQQALTLHASPDWSAAHYDAPDAEAIRLLYDALLAQFPDIPADAIQSSELKRWRYAQVTQAYDASTDGYWQFSTEPQGVLAGDGFLGPRVEAAYLSGCAAASCLLTGTGG